jgi:hypothetical protein
MAADAPARAVRAQPERTSDGTSTPRKRLQRDLAVQGDDAAGSAAADEDSSKDSSEDGHADRPIQPGQRPPDGPPPAGGRGPARPPQPLPALPSQRQQLLPALQSMDPAVRAREGESSLSASLTALARHAVRLHDELGRAAVGGDQTTPLLDGKEAYASMFAAIEGARDHINIESYIVEAKGPAEQLAQLLERKCAEGVHVNLIFDSWGSWTTSATYFERLRQCGVQ